jgi:hypothetical protein
MNRRDFILQQARRQRRRVADWRTPQPTKVELVLDLPTARVLEFRIRARLLEPAEEVTE